MLKKTISGAQACVDRGALRAADPAHRYAVNAHDILKILRKHVGRGHDPELDDMFCEADMAVGKRLLQRV
jgi:hypothetical protein